MDDFVCQDDTIQKVSSFHITGLLRGYEEWKDRFELSCNDFSQELVDDVAKGDRPEVRGGGSVVFFGYEGEKSHIEGLEDLPGSFGFLDDFPDILTDDSPTIVKKL